MDAINQEKKSRNELGNTVKSVIEKYIQMDSINQEKKTLKKVIKKYM